MNGLAGDLGWFNTAAVVGIGALIAYFLPRPQGQRRPAWAPPLAIACLVVEVFLIIRAVRHPGVSWNHGPVTRPSIMGLVDLPAELGDEAVTATSDVHYHGEGFRLNVPAGYRYVKLSPPMLLVASTGDHIHIMNVSYSDGVTENAEDFIVHQLHEKMGASGEFKLSGITESDVALRIWFDTIRDGVAMRGLMVFESRSGKLWQLTVTGSPAEGDAFLHSLERSWMVE